MCLAVPGKILNIDNSQLLTMAEVDFNGVQRGICIDTVDGEIGDYIIAHAGVAVSVMDPATALKTLEDLETMTRYRESLEERSDTQRNLPSGQKIPENNITANTNG